MAVAAPNGLTMIEIPTCCGTPAASDPANGTKFHFSLNVSNMERAVGFYRVLFGVPPAKHHPDYAKFELEQPPLVFSLVPNPPSSGGSLSHFGFPVGTTAEVEAAAARLAAAGLETNCQKGTVCGYARQDKVWVADPDNNYWEIYVVHEDVDPESVRSAFDGIAPRAPATASPAEERQERVIWEHRVLQALPARVPHEDGTVDEVRLEGAFNDRFTEKERGHLLAEALRVLRAGGKLAVHGLVSDRPLAEMPVLPGVGGLVQRVPTEAEPLQELAAAGFAAIRITKLPETAVFQHGGAEMREIKLEAWKPAAPSTEREPRFVLFKGPFAIAVDEDGLEFHRGMRTEVSAWTWDRLAAGSAASQFLFLGDEKADERACG